MRNENFGKPNDINFLTIFNSSLKCLERITYEAN